ncbi:MAG TPA: acetamidase/formamidase family protein [Vicinamibacteria bacterium]
MPGRSTSSRPAGERFRSSFPTRTRSSCASISSGTSRFSVPGSKYPFGLSSEASAWLRLPSRGASEAVPPGVHTGNLDNKELTAGSTLYIPVHVKEALLFIGDGHAAQGDGEVNGTALEASLSGKLQLVVRKDLKLRWPRAETPQHYMTMGLDPDLDVAAEMAVSQMVDHLVQERGLSREDAYVLCSAAVDLRVTQVVDGTKGIHALLPKNIFVGGGR